MGTIEREPEVIDNLTSTSTIDALSAKQGKELNTKISSIAPKTVCPSYVSVTLLCFCVWTSATNGYIDVSFPFLIDTDRIAVTLTSAYLELIGSVTSSSSLTRLYRGSARITVTSSGRTPYTAHAGSVDLKFTQK